MARNRTKINAPWTSLLDISGPFLSPIILKEQFPQGLPALPDGLRPRFVAAYDEWLDVDSGGRRNPAIHTAWIRFVLSDVLELPPDLLREGQRIPPQAVGHLLTEHETLRPDYVLVNPEDADEAPGAPRLLIATYPPDQDLTRKPNDGSRYEASCETRMQELLRHTGFPLGLITNGEAWCLVAVTKDQPTGFATWYADLWREEQETLRAFRALLGVQRCFGESADNRLDALFARSGGMQEEVTNQLGTQVRHAIEILVRTIDKLDIESGREQQRTIDEGTLYEAVVVVMMRIVFLLHAEEKGLFDLDTQPWYAQHYAASTLHGQLQERADKFTEEVLERQYDGWGRLLALFRLVHGGSTHLDHKFLAYGGDLFDPDRFPFLEGRAWGTSWRDTLAHPLHIDNRTVLHLLEAVQYLHDRKHESKVRVSFRALDIEQLGHVYEGLLDHTVKRAIEGDPVLAFIGAGGKEPEIPLSRLAAERAKSEAKFLDFLKDQTGMGLPKLKKLLDAPPDDKLRTDLARATGGDPALYDAALPYAHLLRHDSFGELIVIPAGTAYVTAGNTRRQTGTHYTPRSLTEPIVQHTLDPLVYDGPAEGKPEAEWVLKSPEEILSLKVCDLAMGSGAFLVEACRYLAAKLLQAEGLPASTPDQDDDERRLDAMRRVADHCLYGVDINPLAVDMAKLSLWLITLQRDRAFTFLDHHLKCGDSLVGLWRPEQIRALHIAPERTGRDTPGIWHERLRLLLADTTAERVALESSTVWHAHDYEAKKQALERIEDKLALTKLICDWITAAALATADGNSARRDHRPPERFEEAVVLFANDVLNAMEVVAKEPDAQMTFVSEWTEAIDEMLHDGELTGDLPRFFHWPLEFPEVFVADLPSQRGFHAFVGNPPFIGGQKITGELGVPYRNFLIDYHAHGQRGSADLVAYFFLRAAQLLRELGQFGLIATNTIAQGATREIGLDQIVERGGTIVRAIATRDWPGQAGVLVAHVWIRKGKWSGARILNEAELGGISTSLTKQSRASGKPATLYSNRGRAFQGSIVLGMGFVLSQDEAAILLGQNARNEEVVRPYMTGEDLNTHPEHRPARWAIDFQEMTEEEAAGFSECYDRVKRLVYPERVTKDPKKYPRMVHEWWKYWCARPELLDAKRDQDFVLAIATQATKYVVFGRVPASMVFSNALAIPIDSSPRFFACLSSSFHSEWSYAVCSSLADTIRWAPSDCFETFPFPTSLDSLEDIGERYYTHRQALMKERWEGLTKTYNRFHKPDEGSADIVRLRQLHVEMDQAVAAAYGWHDLDLGHGFHDTKQGLRYTLHPDIRTEVLDRLLELNFARHAEEVAAGLVDEKTGKPIRKKSGSKQTSTSKQPRAKSKHNDVATLPGLEGSE